MSFSLPNEDQKININLSSRALSILDEDIIAFGNNARSNIINRIIANFKEIANSSINQRLLEKRQEYEDLFSTFDNNQLESTISHLLENHKQACLTQIKNLSRSVHSVENTYRHSLKFRINNENLEYLCSDEDCMENLYYNDSIGKYISALIEEYANKNLFDREAIYFREELHLIEHAIQNNRQIKVSLSSGNRIYIAPCRIVSDEQHLYHYLIGTAPTLDIENNIFSYRISRLNNIKIMHSKSAKMTKNEQKRIFSQLHKTGVAFISSTSETIQVRLSETGYKQYLSQQHLRPAYIKKETDANNAYILTFDCTETQIYFYFWKFGCEAEILSPLSLKEKFAKNYTLAYELYQ